MYINSAYLNDSLLNYKDTKNPISVSCCGNYRLITKNQLPTYRSKGRLDYQLIYIASGTKVKSILREYNISDDTRIFRTGTQYVYSELFKNIIGEIQQKKIGYELIIEAYLKQLLVLISRNKESSESKAKTYVQREISLAQEYFSDHYIQDISIDDYAASRGMSISWFIRSFKETTGVTPLQFILSQRIANAQTLLESTDYSINEISSLVGYENPLYFSRLFSKQKGMSPRKYREVVKGK